MRIAYLAVLLVGCAPSRPAQQPCPSCPPPRACPAGLPADTLTIAGLPNAGEKGAELPEKCGGVERWSVKTGTDSDAKELDYGAVEKTTIAKLTKLDWPDPSSKPTKALPDHRVYPIEATVYELRDVDLICFRKESGDDQDLHVVVRAGEKTMIVEIPDPDCVGKKSPVKSLIKGVREAFMTFTKETEVPRCTKALMAQNPSSAAKISLTGLGFFDRFHGGIGQAANGIEIHPVLTICMGKGCSLKMPDVPE